MYDYLIPTGNEATNTVYDVARAVDAVDALMLLQGLRGDDEALDQAMAWITSWQNDVMNYCADGNAEGAARSAAWVTVGWAFYREELLRLV